MAANYGELQSKIVYQDLSTANTGFENASANEFRSKFDYYELESFFTNHVEKIKHKANLYLVGTVLEKELTKCKVIYNPPATVVIWSDDTKTVVKTTDGEKFDPERGFLQAFYEKFSGLTRTQGNKLLKDLREQYEEVENELD